VVIKERLINYYALGAFVVANTLSSIPFLLLIAIVCSMLIIFISGLSQEPMRVLYFIANIFVSLLAVESMMVRRLQPWPLATQRLPAMIAAIHPPRAPQCMICNARRLAQLLYRIVPTVDPPEACAHALGDVWR
jgi:hypothetical protein